MAMDKADDCACVPVDYLIWMSFLLRSGWCSAVRPVKNVLHVHWNKPITMSVIVNLSNLLLTGMNSIGEIG